MIADQQHLEKMRIFMHHAPLAMAETDVQGVIRQVNPKAIQLMMPMAVYLGLSGENLLDTLTGFLPQLKQTIGQFTSASGLIINQEPYRITFDRAQNRIEHCFSLTIEKISADSLLIFFDDVTDFLVKVESIRVCL